MGSPRTYYAASANAAPERPPLTGDFEADICVIGAGYSGLSTALHLAESGYKVAVLEAEKVGFGASGRNGGQIINGYSRDYDTILARYGRDTADALLAMSFEGGDIIRARIAQYNISCDYKEGSFFAAFNAKQMKELEHQQATWARAGNDTLSLYNKEQTREVSSTQLYIGGLLDRKGGHIHPLNLALGEAAALESLGGRIFENSRVTHLDGSTAHTARGRVKSKFTVICGNAYLGDAVPQLSRRIMSVSSQIVATAPLGPDTAKALMPAGFSVEDCNYLLDYYRITADNRLLFGGGVVYSGAEPADVERRLRPHIARTFPQLRGVKIDFAWSGNFALTLTRMPHIGRLSDTVYFIQGDSGHGVAPCHLLGRLVAEAIHGQATRFDSFANMRNFPFPGGRLFRVPLTALGAWYYSVKEILGL